MALDKLVDSTQLDSDLTSVANAIRAKGGTSASLAFPADFVSEIGNIPSGGGGGLSWIDYTATSQTNNVPALLAVVFPNDSANYDNYYVGKLVDKQTADYVDFQLVNFMTVRKNGESGGGRRYRTTNSQVGNFTPVNASWTAIVKVGDKVKLTKVT